MTLPSDLHDRATDAAMRVLSALGVHDLTTARVEALKLKLALDAAAARTGVVPAPVSAAELEPHWTERNEED